MKFKWLVLGLFFLVSIPAQAQLYIQFPTNVRFLGGNFNNSRPYFKTLDAALNDVKTLASSENPYTFWVSSDTVFIADWDSTYSGSTLSIKDSIDQYYVATGKIKWAGFGFGGSGGGTVSIVSPDDTTLHYGWKTWNQDNTALPQWQRDIGQTLDSADYEVWRLIIYLSQDSILYIENDTLKVNYSKLGPFLDGYITASVPYESDIVKSDSDKTLSADYTLTGTLSASSGGYMKQGTANTTHESRVFWSDGDSLYYMIDDTDTLTLAMRNWTHSNFQSLSDTLKHGISSFATTDSIKFVTVMGAGTNDGYIVTPILSDSTVYIGEISSLAIVPKVNGFTVKRDPTHVISGMSFAWIRLKRGN